MGPRADLRLQDCCDVGGAFDRIVPIAMLEAMSEAFSPHYFRVLRDCLNPAGIS
jgi:cyclopropane fatty-acyl-phospholipid synthase-like methyltransferase